MGPPAELPSWSHRATQRWRQQSLDDVKKCNFRLITNIGLQRPALRKIQSLTFEISNLPPSLFQNDHACCCHIPKENWINTCCVIPDFLTVGKVTQPQVERCFASGNHRVLLRSSTQ